MQALIAQVAEEGDSIGGVIECCAIGLPKGLGSPMFNGVENKLARALFSIPATRGVEFGAGFAAAKMRGSQHNDAFCVKDGEIASRTNNSGGIQGGITNGMPIILRAAIKPTPSIALEQDSVDMATMQDVKLRIQGRHDPCIAIRALPAIEAVTAMTILDIILSERNI